MRQYRRDSQIGHERVHPRRSDQKQSRRHNSRLTPIDSEKQSKRKCAIIAKISVKGNYSVIFKLLTSAIHSSFINMTRRASAPPANFEAATTELERIVAEMESGQLTLDQSLASYQRGAELLQFCQSALNAAQQQVQILENGALNNFNTVATQDDN